MDKAEALRQIEAILEEVEKYGYAEGHGDAMANVERARSDSYDRGYEAGYADGCEGEKSKL